MLSISLRESIAVKIIRHVILVVACLVTLVPIFFLFLNSFKSVDEFFKSPFAFPTVWRFSNYLQAWTEANVRITLRNSIIVSIGGVALNLLLCLPAAYAFARLKFRFHALLYFLFVGGMVVQEQMILLPLLVMMSRLHMTGSLYSLVIAYAAMSMPMSVLFLTSFLGTIPKEIEDAARIDGASSLRVLTDIVLPLARPGIATVAIIIGIWIWNDFLIALIIATIPSIQTLPLGIMMFYGEYMTEWTLAFASVVIAAGPFIIAYLLLTRQFMEGLTFAAVR